MDKTIDNNQVTLSGSIISPFRFSHEVFGEGFYMFDLSVGRLSECTDVIPVMASERLLNIHEDQIGKFAEINGQFRSYNYHSENRNRLLLSVFAREITLSDDESDIAKPNSIFLDGYVCKKPVYRKTPLGREISDLLLAVNRPYGKSDYIPCICWGRNARFADSFSVGGHVQLWGRIQSREYQKKISETETEKRIAYEVSVNKLDYLGDAVCVQ